MANPSKQKGTAWETAVVNWLNNWWPHVERRTLTGSADKGDIAGLVGVVIECKNHKTHQLAKWTDELNAEMANANADLGVLAIKRHGKAHPQDAYYLITGQTLIRLLEEWTK